MKKHFSFPVRFIEELNALNFSYKSIHLMAHHGRWQYYVVDQHTKLFGIEATEELRRKRREECTSRHYLCRLIDLNGVTSYDFIDIHNLCEEWNFAGEKTSALPAKTYDPFGCGYSSHYFKNLEFQRLTFFTPELVNCNTDCTVFDLTVKNKIMADSAHANHCIAHDIVAFMDTAKSRVLFKEAKKIVYEPTAFIAAFFGFATYVLPIKTAKGEVIIEKENVHLQANDTAYKLFYRDC